MLQQSLFRYLDPSMPKNRDVNASSTAGSNAHTNGTAAGDAALAKPCLSTPSHPTTTRVVPSPHDTVITTPRQAPDGKSLDAPNSNTTAPHLVSSQSSLHTPRRSAHTTTSKTARLGRLTRPRSASATTPITLLPPEPVPTLFTRPRRATQLKTPTKSYGSDESDSSGDDEDEHDEDDEDDDEDEEEGGVRGAVLTEYEAARNERIEQNKKRMRELGLDTLAKGAAEAVEERPVKVAKRVVKVARRVSSAAVVTRRSSRRPGGTPAPSSEAHDADTPRLNPIIQDPTPEIEPQLFPSSVLTYMVDSGGTSPNVVSMHERCSRPIESTESLRGYPQMAASLHDPTMKAVYSMDWHNNLVIAAGKEGRTSLFAVPNHPGNDDDITPIMSCKLHKSWIAEAQFIPRTNAAESAGGDVCEGPGIGELGISPQLITASNNGEMCLWDLALVNSDGVPKCETKCDSVHSSGIFSMDVHRSINGESIQAATASKDASVAVSHVLASGFRVTTQWHDVHASVVKCVRWRSGTTLASCGNDRAIRILDVRTSTVQQSMTQSHTSAVNNLQWAPGVDPNLLVSSSFDPVIRIFDIRSPLVPVHELTGHTAVSHCAQIYQPQFAWGGRGVLTTGEKSGGLTLFDLNKCDSNRDTKESTAACIASFGALDINPSCLRTSGHLVAVAAPKRIHILRAEIAEPE